MITVQSFKTILIHIIDIPGSDEEPEIASSTTGALGSQGSQVQFTVTQLDDDARSQASTQIEDDHSCSDRESNDEGNEGIPYGDYGDNRSVQGIIPSLFG